MSDAPLLVFITSIAPHPENRGGPSGLPWEIIKELKQAGWDVRVQLVPLATGPVRLRLMQLGVHLSNLDIEREGADAYIAYPFYLGRLIPYRLRPRTIVLGPDASSMLYARFARIESGWRRWRSLCLVQWFALQERWVAKHFAGMAVVGRNDTRWLRQVIGTSAFRALYIPHPVLRSVANPTPSKGKELKPRLVFAGDLSRKYVGDFFDTLDFVTIAKTLHSADCQVLVVGKGNRAVHDTIADHLPSSYITWIDDYSTLCDPMRDMHVIPLMAGAGTKNRTLTALAMNVIMISTPIGTENIDATVLSAASVHRFRSSADFSHALILALADLHDRRTSKEDLAWPPIKRISNEFISATIRLASTPTTSNTDPSSPQK